MPLGIKAAGAILFYMEITHHHSLGHVSFISRIDEGDFVWIDKFTFRNLEIFTPLAGVEGISLLETIDRSGSPMGARRLREWLAMPIKDISELTLRYDTISAFQADEMMLEKVRVASEISEIWRGSSPRHLQASFCRVRRFNFREVWMP